jgi:hypothetical protein
MAHLHHLFPSSWTENNKSDKQWGMVETGVWLKQGYG